MSLPLLQPSMPSAEDLRNLSNTAPSSPVTAQLASSPPPLQVATSSVSEKSLSTAGDMSLKPIQSVLFDVRANQMNSSIQSSGTLAPVAQSIQQLSPEAQQRLQYLLSNLDQVEHSSRPHHPPEMEVTPIQSDTPSVLHQLNMRSLQRSLSNSRPRMARPSIIRAPLRSRTSSIRASRLRPAIGTSFRRFYRRRW